MVIEEHQSYPVVGQAQRLNGKLMTYYISKYIISSFPIQSSIFNFFRSLSYKQHTFIAEFLFIAAHFSQEYSVLRKLHFLPVFRHRLSGTLQVASKKDLIWLKLFRNSKQDQADIERLYDDKN